MAGSALTPALTHRPTITHVECHDHPIRPMQSDQAADEDRVAERCRRDHDPPGTTFESDGHGSL